MPGPGREFELRLYRDSPSTPWGFRLQGGKDLSAQLSVQKITPCTPADGELERGDIILEMQSNAASKLTHAQAKDLIRNAGGSLLLRIQRTGYVPYTPPAPVTPSYTQISARPINRPRNVQKPFNSDFGVDYNRQKYAPAPVKAPTPQYEIGYYNQPSGVMLNRLQDSLSSSVLRSHSPASSTGYLDYSNPSTPTGGHNKYPTWGPSSSSRKPNPPSPASNSSATPWRNNSGGRAPQGRIIAQTEFGGVVTDERPAWLGSLRSSTNPHGSDAHPSVAATAGAGGPPPPRAQSPTGGAYPHRPKVQSFHYGADGSQEYRQGEAGGSASAAHLQYNSPIGLYSKQNVHAAMSSQLNGRPGEGTIGIVSDTEVRKMVEAEEQQKRGGARGGRSRPPPGGPDNGVVQSPSVRQLEAQLGVNAHSAGGANFSDF